MPAVVSWIAVLATLVITPIGSGALLILLPIIVYASFGVMRHADALARRLGEPFGTIILTLSISVIEVALVASALIGGGSKNASIVSDTAFSASMILLNFILGLAVFLGGRRYGTLTFHAAGASQYLATIVTFSALTFAFPHLLASADARRGPNFITSADLARGGELASSTGLMGGSTQPTPLSTEHALTIGLIMLALYIFFMWRQLGANSADFADPDPAPRSDDPALKNFLWLVATLLPVVLLANVASPLITKALPHSAIAGLLIAIIVLLPETFTTLKAGRNGELQRASNLTHGALVSVLGMSVPSVLLISVLTGHDVVLGAGASELGLLGLTLALSISVLAGRQATALHGMCHLVIFAMYIATLV
ncbi:calcium:proton antiporter [Trueperella bialowiezensis]|uniref:Calcium/proton antiporter n=1 Tax=Trueperella bialowiezensis TaxID=312285 RepID=A0A3S4Z643_9ACTO|nr:hypothetical protein [Trueperella bialowiezensis]VEI13810.1 Calcium/proton antiporter [Trueperella bialowiezensis]